VVAILVRGTVGVMVAQRATTLAVARRHGDFASPRPLPPILLAAVARRAEVPEFHGAHYACVCVNAPRPQRI
jgi:hypothetical protein